jgi:DNA repair photolyase
MGGTILEPRVPHPSAALSWLDKLVALTKDVRRIRFRFDPIVHVKLPDGTEYTNLRWLEKFAPSIKQTGIADVSISWMSVYRKVAARLRRAGIEILDVTSDHWQNDYSTIMEIADRFNFNIHGCCVPELSRSKCIDGFLLSELHPFGESCSIKKAKGQRTSCGCTESLDIGWYFKCTHGCRYCYANPMEWDR